METFSRVRAQLNVVREGGYERAQQGQGGEEEHRGERSERDGRDRQVAERSFLVGV